LTRFLTDRNENSHYKPWDTDFTVQSRNEAYKKSVQELSKKIIHVQTKDHWLSHYRSLKYATGSGGKRLRSFFRAASLTTEPDL